MHNSPFDGLAIYGAYSTPKQTICHENNFFHFAFYNAEGQLINHRLVKLGVEQPTTQSPTEEYMDGITGDDFVGEYEEFYDEEDEEDFPNGSLDY